MASETVKIDNGAIPDSSPNKILDTPANGSLEAAEEAAAVDDPVTDVQKKMKRAERFGMPVLLSEKHKRNSRAERFGSAASSNETDAVRKAEEQKRKARAERFGLPAEPVSDEEAKKKARLNRFTAPAKVDNVEDDKRKARALRFSQPSAGAVPDVAVDGNIEPKAAVAGNAGAA